MNARIDFRQGPSIAVGRVGEVLDAIASAPKGTTALEVATALGISRAAALRLLDSMVVAGIARRDEDSKRYFPGLLLYHWGARAAMSYLPTALIRHEMVLLTRSAGHPAFYAVLLQDAVIVLERTQEVAGELAVVPYTTHYHWPMSTTGAVLVAFAPAAERERLLEREQHLERESIWPNADLPEVLEQVARDGFAERTLGPGRTTLAAPLLDASGYAVAALGLAVSAYTPADRERLPLLLKDAAARCSGFLGHVAALSAP